MRKFYLRRLTVLLAVSGLLIGCTLIAINLKNRKDPNYLSSTENVNLIEDTIVAKGPFWRAGERYDFGSIKTKADIPIRSGEALCMVIDDGSHEGSWTVYVYTDDKTIMWGWLDFKGEEEVCHTIYTLRDRQLRIVKLHFVIYGLTEDEVRAVPYYRVGLDERIQ